MTVNEHLAALMRVIEEHQDKMPEGEYLEAMNALGALHRQQEKQAPVHRIVINDDPPPSYAASAPLFAEARILPPGMAGNLTELRALDRVNSKHPDPFWNKLSPQEWIVLSYETRYELIREATEHYVTQRESNFRNPNPEVCPFIARHAFGMWDFENNGHSQWECVCGYIGKVKHWKKHEQSERHQDWAKHRTVSRWRINKMKTTVNDNEAGDFVRYGSGNHADAYPGGIRFYQSCQERNEWTHPEMFATELSPMKDGSWFVHPRIIRDREYA
jgi:hypothetical protein